MPYLSKRTCQIGRITLSFSRPRRKPLGGLISVLHVGRLNELTPQSLRMLALMTHRTFTFHPMVSQNLISRLSKLISLDRFTQRTWHFTISAPTSPIREGKSLLLHQQQGYMAVRRNLSTAPQSSDVLVLREAWVKTLGCRQRIFP